MTSARRCVTQTLGTEIVLFGVASLVHRGILATGYEHTKAALAEAIIALVLGVGLFISLIRPAAARISALLVQWFALLGVSTGVVMIAIGVGPRTGADVALHALMFAVLGYGLRSARRMVTAQT